YGYIKNHKKTVKNGQTRTWETEEHKRSWEFKAKVKKSKPWSNLQSNLGQQKSKPLKDKNPKSTISVPQ
ncbi:hypothetical protein Tco_0145291, partial [Tanacetum coccineum]